MAIKKTMKPKAKKSPRAVTRRASVTKSSTKKRVAKKTGFLSAKTVAVGSGLAALGAATYYLFGPKGKEHQKALKAWSSSMKKDIDAQYKKANAMTQSAYHEIVDRVAKSYAKSGKAQLKDVTAYAQTLKKQWKQVSKKATTVKRSAAKALKR